MVGKTRNPDIRPPELVILNNKDIRQKIINNIIIK